MRDKTATFIGHKDCYGVQEEVVRSYIIELIESGVTEFLCGDMGSFDWMCARIVYKLKKQYPQVRSFLVIPYLTFNDLDREYFDDVIYPEGFEKYHFKAAIPARNKYMIENSAYAVCYVDRGWGGAAQTYAKAIKKGLVIKNFGSYTAPHILSGDGAIGAVIMSGYLLVQHVFSF